MIIFIVMWADEIHTWPDVLDDSVPQNAEPIALKRDWDISSLAAEVLSWGNQMREKSRIKWYIQWIIIFLEKFHIILQNDSVEQAWKEFIALYKEFTDFKVRFSEFFWNQENPSFKAVLSQLHHLITPVLHIWAQFETQMEHLPEKLIDLIWDILKWSISGEYDDLYYRKIAKNYVAFRKNWSSIIENVRSYKSVIDKVWTNKEFTSVNSFIERFFEECPDIERKDCGYENIPEDYKINSVVFQIIFDNLVSNYKKYGVNGKIYFRVQDGRLSITFENDFKKEVWSVVSSKVWSDVLNSCVNILWGNVVFPKDSDEKFVLKIEGLELVSEGN